MLELNTSLTTDIDHDGDPLTPVIPKNTFKIGAKNLTLNVAGQQLSGDFFFSQTGAGTGRVIRLSAANVTLFLGAPTAGISITHGSGQFLVTNAGIAGQLSADITPVLPASLDGVISIPTISVSLQINNTTREVVDGLLDLPAGPVRARRGHDSGDADAAHDLRTDRQRHVRLRAGQGRRPGRQAQHLRRHEDPEDRGFELRSEARYRRRRRARENGSAKLLLTPDGIAGEIVAAAASTSARRSPHRRTRCGSRSTRSRRTTWPLAVDEQFQINGVTETLSLPAGHYITVALTGLAITIAGQSVTGDFSVSQFTKLGPNNKLTADTRTRITIANLALRIGTDQRDFVTVSNGNGVLELTSPGVFGHIGATVAVNIPGITVGGTFDVRINTTTGRRRPRTAWRSTAGFAVKGTNVFLEAFGQRLSGNFTFTKTANQISIDLDHVTLALGNGSRDARDGDDLERPDPRVQRRRRREHHGVRSSSHRVSPPTSRSGSARSRSRSTRRRPRRAHAVVNVAGRTLRVVVRNMDIVVIGQSMHVGEFTFEQTTTAANTKVVRIGFTDVNLDIGAAGASISFQDISGALLITPQGIAGKLTGRPTASLPGLNFTISSDVDIEFNRSRVAVHERSEASSSTSRPARSSASAANHLTMTIEGTSVTADFLFETATRANNTTVTKIGIANLDIAGQITGARGALLILPKCSTCGGGNGIAGVVMGNVPGLGGTSVGFSINTLSEPGPTGCLASTPRPSPKCVDVDETVTVNGVDIHIQAKGHQRFQALVQANFNFGTCSRCAGDFSIDSNGAFSGQGLEIFLGKGPR